MRNHCNDRRYVAIYAIVVIVVDENSMNQKYVRDMFHNDTLITSKIYRFGIQPVDARRRINGRSCWQQ